MHTNLEMEGLTIGNKSWFTFIKKLVKKSLLLLAPVYVTKNREASSS